MQIVRKLICPLVQFRVGNMLPLFILRVVYLANQGYSIGCAHDSLLTQLAQAGILRIRVFNCGIIPLAQ
ncbi:MAG TPA: hypothetical protein VKU38_04870, partial [Ktedonobacteraceae bacterium]|nr:hypothetical protein [Ktedonobacteraceae bacterium]